MMLRLAALALALAVLTVDFPASAQTDACTMVPTGTFQDINVFSDCKRVTNNSGTTVCAVSQVDASQWQSFYNSPPGNVTIGACGSTCAGYSSNGYCFFAGAAGQSCNTVCSSRGGCSAAGTAWVANSTNCQNTTGAMGYSTWNGTVSTGYAAGCITYPAKATYAYIDSGGTCAAVDSSNLYGRICACLNGQTAPCNGTYTWAANQGLSPPEWRDVAVSTDGQKLAFVYPWRNIFTSSDGGATFVQRTGSGANGWTKVESSSDGSILFAITSTGTVHKSSDSGATWSQSQPQGTSIYDIAISADGQRIALAYYSAASYSITNIITSTNGGTSWTSQSGSGTRHWPSVAMSADGLKIVAASRGYDYYIDGEGFAEYYDTPGYLMTSADGGVTWTQRLVEGQLKLWKAVASSADGMKLVAAADSEGIFTSSNGGSTWVKRTGAGTSYGSFVGTWQSIESSADGNLIIAAGQGTFVSADGGVTWAQQSSSNLGAEARVEMTADGTKAFIVRYSGYPAFGTCP